MRITEREARGRYNKRHGVNFLRQLWFGGQTIAREFGMKPCPRCHGNDKTEQIREAPGFILAECTRCGVNYLA